MWKKEPPVTLYHHDTRNGSCIVLRHDSGDLFELYMAKIRHGRCPDLCHSDMVGKTKREIMTMVVSARSNNKDKIELKVNGHVGELEVKRVEKYLQGINELLKIQNPRETKKKKRKIFPQTGRVRA